jgi:two-component system cell cycle sensor histidine kinase/response regulator CckA
MFAEKTDAREPGREVGPGSPPGEALLAAIVAASDDAIISKSIDGTILSWNASAERLLGWTAADAIRSPIALVIPPELHGEEARVIARLSAGEHIRHYETLRLHRDGRRVEVSLSISPIRDAAGRVTTAAAILRDIGPEREVERERGRLLEAERAARLESERMRQQLEDQALDLENQAMELEAAIEDLNTANAALTEEREAARLAKRVLDAVIDQLPVGLYVTEAPSGQLVLHNRRASELLGHPPLTADGGPGFPRYLGERLDGSPYSMAERPLVRAATRGETVEQEVLRYPRPDGSVVHLSVSAAPVHDASGVPVMAVCTFLDVSARLAAERELAERDALMGGFFGAPGLMMMVAEAATSSDGRPDFRILLANAEMSRQLASSSDGIDGRTAREIGLPERDIAYYAELLARVHAGGTPVTLELPSRLSAGAWHRVSMSPIAGQETGPPRCAVVTVDVTEERRTEEGRLRLQLLVENATDFIGVASLSLNLDYVNAAGLALIEAESLERVRGTPVLNHFEEAGRALMESEVVPALQAHSRWAGEIVLRSLRTGEAVPVEMTIFAIADPESGATVNYGYVCRPIGERQRLQAELRQAQKMEAVGQLAGGIAHDFNNLLSVILSYASLLREDLPPNDPSRSHVEEIRLAAARAATLTRQLLAYSRQQVLEPSVVNLNDIVTAVEGMLRRVIGEHIEMVAALSRDLGNALVDPGQVEQVIMNLAVNSRDAMPRGGKLTIETRNITLDQGDEQGAAGPHVMLAITDTGAGMDAATQARIFEPFFTTKEMGKGTGLGLSTVFGIVKQSGGSVRVSSEPGKGTTMRIYFPRVEGVARVAVSTGSDRGGERGTETILLVEDDQPVRIAVATLLRRFGYRVVDVGSGEEAMRVAGELQAAIHLVLTDVIMPRLSGPELAEQLRRTRPGIRVLFMSGYTDRSIASHSLIGTDVAFLQKPATPERLARKVREVLDAPPARLRS